MILKEAVCKGVDWIHVAENRDHWRPLVNIVMNFRILQWTGNLLTSWGTISFGRTLFS